MQLFSDAVCSVLLGSAASPRPKRAMSRGVTACLHDAPPSRHRHACWRLPATLQKEANTQQPHPHVGIHRGQEPRGGGTTGEPLSTRAQLAALTPPNNRIPHFTLHQQPHHTHRQYNRSGSPPSRSRHRKLRDYRGRSVIRSIHLNLHNMGIERKILHAVPPARMQAPFIGGPVTFPRPNRSHRDPEGSALRGGLRWRRLTVTQPCQLQLARRRQHRWLVGRPEADSYYSDPWASCEKWHGKRSKQ